MKTPSINGVIMPKIKGESNLLKDYTYSLYRFTASLFVSFLRLAAHSGQ